MIIQALLRSWYLTTVETQMAPSISWCLVSPKRAWFTIYWWTNFPTFARTWVRLSALVGSNWKPKIHYSPCQKLKEEARVRFRINEMLFHCLDNLKVYKVICYSITEVGCVTKKLGSFRWKVVLVSPSWCDSNKSRFQQACKG